MSDIVLPFTIYNHQIKGRAIKSEDAIDVILKKHNYNEETARVLSNLLLISILLGSQFKDQITLTIELRVKNKNNYMVADYQSPGLIRGYANLDPSKLQGEELFLSVTIDHAGNRYQGVVEVEDLNLEKAIEKYFNQSEQIKTSIKLASWIIAGSWCCGAIMIQALPSSFNNEEEIWDEATILFNTIKASELVEPQLPADKLLYNVYNETSIHVFEAIKVIHECRCSLEKAEQILKSINSSEIDNYVIDGNISVDCQFCNSSQKFTLSEVKALHEQ